MKAIMFFASGPSKNRKELGQREISFFERVRKNLNRDVIILFVEQIINFSPPCRYSTLMTSNLLETGLPSENIVVLPVFGDATVKELDAAEIYLTEHPEIKKIYAASSWYHLPRIWLMWLFRHGRSVRFFPIWTTEKAVLIETLKYPLLFTPLSWQGKLGRLWTRIFHQRNKTSKGGH